MGKLSVFGSQRYFGWETHESAHHPASMGTHEHRPFHKRVRNGHSRMGQKSLAQTWIVDTRNDDTQNDNLFVSSANLYDSLVKWKGCAGMLFPRKKVEGNE